MFDQGGEIVFDVRLQMGRPFTHDGQDGAFFRVGDRLERILRAGFQGLDEFLGGEVLPLSDRLGQTVEILGEDDAGIAIGMVDRHVGDGFHRHGGLRTTLRLR